MPKLMAHAAAKFLIGVLLVGALIFLPAGTLRYGLGWLFMGLMFVPMLALGAALLLKAPTLLEKRLNGREREKAQSAVVALSGVMFAAAFILAGLDFRFGWTRVPRWLTLAAVIQLAAYALYAEVMRENAYLSRTVKVQKGQKVIDTGLYGRVRHPMYSATVLMYLAMPLVLGSWPAFCTMLCYPALIIRRIRNEEELLARELEGYAEYRRRVKYRLFPGIW